jgi:hypothetical protein
MVRRIALLLTLTSWNCAQAQIAPEPPVTVPAFTRVEVKLEEQISSKTNHTGDRFKLTITNDVYIDDFLAIPAGSEGEGEVVHASKAGFGGKPGELILAARFVNVGESRIPLRSLRLNATGKGHFDEALVMTMLVPKVSGFFIEGGNIVVPSDTLAEAAIAEDVQLPPTANVGTVVFFRSPKLAGLGTRYKVREDDRELGKLSRATYFSIQVPAGTHHYWAFYEGPDLITLDVEPGETYYVRGELSQGLLNPHPNLTPSDKATFESMKPKLTDVTGKHIAVAPEPQTTEQ